MKAEDIDSLILRRDDGNRNARILIGMNYWAKSMREGRGSMYLGTTWRKKKRSFSCMLRGHKKSEGIKKREERTRQINTEEILTVWLLRVRRDRTLKTRPASQKEAYRFITS